MQSYTYPPVRLDQCGLHSHHQAMSCIQLQALKNDIGIAIFVSV